MPVANVLVISTGDFGSLRWAERGSKLPKSERRNLAIHETLDTKGATVRARFLRFVSGLMLRRFATCISPETPVEMTVLAKFLISKFFNMLIGTFTSRSLCHHSWMNFSSLAVLQLLLDELPLALAGGSGRIRQLKQAVIHSTAFLKHFRAEIHLCSPAKSVTGKGPD